MALVAVAMVALLCVAPAAAQKLPTEEELDRKLKGPPPDDRNYQRRSAKSFGGRTSGAASWVRNKLSGFNVTPGRLCLALGIVGFLFSRNKNTRNNSGWLVIYVVSILMVLGGGVAMGLKYFG